MQIEKRTMGWIQKPSAYQYSQQLNAKRKALAQSFIDSQAAASTALFSAQDNFVAGTVENAYKAVIKNAQEKAKTQLDEVGDIASTLNKTA